MSIFMSPGSPGILGPSADVAADTDSTARSSILKDNRSSILSTGSKTSSRIKPKRAKAYRTQVDDLQELFTPRQVSGGADSLGTVQEVAPNSDINVTGVSEETKAASFPIASSPRVANSPRGASLRDLREVRPKAGVSMRRSKTLEISVPVALPVPDFSDEPASPKTPKSPKLERSKSSSSSLANRKPLPPKNDPVDGNGDVSENAAGSVEPNGDKPKGMVAIAEEANAEEPKTMPKQAGVNSFKEPPSVPGTLDQAPVGEPQSVPGALGRERQSRVSFAGFAQDSPQDNDSTGILDMYKEYRSAIHRVLLEDLEKKVDAIVGQAMRLHVAYTTSGDKDLSAVRQAIIEADAFPQPEEKQQQPLSRNTTAAFLGRKQLVPSAGQDTLSRSLIPTVGLAHSALAHAREALADSVKPTLSQDVAHFRSSPTDMGNLTHSLIPHGGLAAQSPALEPPSPRVRLSRRLPEKKPSRGLPSKKPSSHGERKSAVVVAIASQESKAEMASLTSGTARPSYVANAPKNFRPVATPHLRDQINFHKKSVRTSDVLLDDEGGSHRHHHHHHHRKEDHGLLGWIHDHNPMNMFHGGGHNNDRYNEDMPMGSRTSDKGDNGDRQSRRSSLTSSSSYGSSDGEEDCMLHRGIFAHGEDLKMQVRFDTCKPQYDVKNFYHRTGVCQYIARSSIFETLTLIMISINCIWIAIDIDMNHDPLFLDADPVFIIADMIFWLFFLSEWLIRFGAFSYKRDGLRDVWFLFDGGLAIMNTFDTWVLTALVALAVGVTPDSDWSFLRLIRIVRLVRLCRMVHVMKAFPELMVVVKGMRVAARAVASTIVLMLFIIYAFAVGIRQITDNTEIGRRRFQDVPTTTRFLLLTGTVPDLNDYTEEIWEEGALYALVYMFFALIISITVMNMLVGVLVGVVQSVAAAEQEQLMVEFVRTSVLKVLHKLNVDEDHSGTISRNEFELLIQEPVAIKSFEQMGVDIVGLCDVADYIFTDGSEVSFPQFMELVMELRGTNNATVKDVVDLRKFIILELHHLEENVVDMMANLIEVIDDSHNSEDKAQEFRRTVRTTGQAFQAPVQQEAEAQGGLLSRITRGGGGGPPKLKQQGSVDETGLKQAEAAMAMTAAETSRSTTGTQATDRSTTATQQDDGTQNSLGKKKKKVKLSQKNMEDVKEEKE